MNLVFEWFRSFIFISNRYNYSTDKITLTPRMAIESHYIQSLNNVILLDLIISFFQL